MCTECGEVKSLDGFHRNKSKKDGHIHTCKPCTLAYQKRQKRQRLLGKKREPHTKKGEKFCMRCDMSRSLEHFTKDSRAVDGKARYCRECSRSYLKRKRKERKERSTGVVTVDSKVTRANRALKASHMTSGSLMPFVDKLVETARGLGIGSIFVDLERSELRVRGAWTETHHLETGTEIVATGSPVLPGWPL